MDFSFDGIAVKLAGVAGAVVSMRFLQGTFIERAALAAGGAALSYYASPHVSFKTGLPEGLAGFLIGMFGMAVLSKIWEWIQNTPVGAVWQVAIDALKKWAGV